jgi:hypothetical protein
MKLNQKVGQVWGYEGCNYDGDETKELSSVVCLEGHDRIVYIRPWRGRMADDGYESLSLALDGLKETWAQTIPRFMEEQEAQDLDANAFLTYPDILLADVAGGDVAAVLGRGG